MTDMAMVHRELLIEPPGDARDKGCGDEDGGEDEGDGHHGPGDLFHGFLGCLLGGESLLDMVLHCLHHDDGVINHKADGKDQAEEGQGIDGEAEEREEGKGTDQGDGDRAQGYEGRPPPLEEEEYHDDDEDEGFDQGLDDLFHALSDCLGGV